MLLKSVNVEQGDADIFLDCYVVIPRCCRYLTGLIAPNDILFRLSLYLRMLIYAYNESIPLTFHNEVTIEVIMLFILPIDMQSQVLSKKMCV